MIGVPGTWLRLANGNYRPRWRAAILDAAGSPLVESLPVVGGQITRDETATPRTTANVSIPTGAVPALLDQAYLPTGNRLVVEHSIDDRTDTWIVMADLDIAASALARPENMWTVAAVDRAARIGMDDLLRTNVPTIGGMTVAAAVELLVQRTFGGDRVHATGPALTQTVPTKYGGELLQGSTWTLIAALCAEAQSEAFYDQRRDVQIRPIPGVAATAVDTLGVGADGTAVGYVVKHELGVNTVVLVYQNPTNDQVLRRAVAQDRRATSPVAVQRVGSHITWAELIRADDAPSQAAADAAAAAILTREGKPRAVELAHPPRPWLEPGDTVEVTFLGGPTEKQVVESVGVDLGPAGVQVTRLRNHDYQMSTEVP